MQPSHPTAALSSAVTLSFFPSDSGGRIITLEGRGFGLVQNVSMAVRGIGRERTVGAGPAVAPRWGSARASGRAGSALVLGSDVLPLLFQRCKVHTDTAITCPSPAASNVTAGTKPAPVDFYLNGRLYADERSALDEEMYPEEALHISKFSLGYYADPQFSTAKKEKWIKHHPGEPLTLVIHVRGWW